MVLWFASPVLLEHAHCDGRHYVSLASSVLGTKNEWHAFWHSTDLWIASFLLLHGKHCQTWRVHSMRMFDWWTEVVECIMGMTGVTGLNCTWTTRIELPLFALTPVFRWGSHNLLLAHLQWFNILWFGPVPKPELLSRRWVLIHLGSIGISFLSHLGEMVNWWVEIQPPSWTKYMPPLWCARIGWDPRPLHQLTWRWLYIKILPREVIA